MQCPSCDRKRGQVKTEIFGVYRCSKCEAIYGTCYLGDSYRFVLPYMTQEQVPDERLRYFDFRCLGSKGIGRRHGWYDPKTKLIVQVG